MSASGSVQSIKNSRTATSTTPATIAQSGGYARRYVYNDSAANLFVLLGIAGTVSATAFTFKLATNTGVYVEAFGGAIQGLLDSGTGNAQVSEW